MHCCKVWFLRNLQNLPADQVVSIAESLCYTYRTDLETSLSEWTLAFSAFLKTEFAERSLDLTTTSTTSPAAPKFVPVPALVETSLDNVDVESAELRMYKLIVAKKMETVFPNTVIALRIYLCLMISNCSCERSFSKLQLIKNQLRSCMTQTRLNSLTLLSVQYELLRDIDLSSLIRDFSLLKSRKHDF